MKKLILLCAIVCAGQLYGMQNDSLPKELGEHLAGINNLKGFNAVMNKLAEKFPNSTREEIAKRINTPLAKKYVEFNKAFVETILTEDSDARLRYAQTYLKRDADPNFTFRYGDNSYGSVLGTAYNMAVKNNGEDDKLVELLLNVYKAKPNVKHANTTLIKFSQEMTKQHETR